MTMHGAYAWTMHGRRMKAFGKGIRIVWARIRRRRTMHGSLVHGCTYARTNRAFMRSMPRLWVVPRTGRGMERVSHAALEVARRFEGMSYP